MNYEKVVIIIPTYNEAMVIQDTINAVFKATQSIANFDVHVLIFDSASTDDTQKIVKNLAIDNPRLHLKTELKKSGLGSAYLQAMHYALNELAADIVFEFDADLSHNPKYIEPMLETIKTCDVVVGSRYVPGGSIPSDWGWHRKLMSVLGNWIARLALTTIYKDFTSGFRATRRQVLNKVLPKQFLSSQYAYKIQLLWLLHQYKAKIREYPIEFVDRQKGFSKLPANSIIDSLRVLFILRYYEMKQYLKMCLVGVSGMTVQFLVYNLIRYYFSPFCSQAIAVTAAIINNFILNSQFTFNKNLTTPHVNKIKSFIIFLAYSLLFIVLQSYWLQIGIKLIGSGVFKENMILISGMIFGSFLNYFIYSRLVWSQ